MDLLDRISEHEAGRHWWKALSRFEKLAFYRIRREAAAEMKIKLAEADGHGHGHANGNGNGVTGSMGQRKS